MRVFGGIEAGGTKIVCSVGTGPDDIRAETRFPTGSPDETMRQVIEFFQVHQQKSPLAAIGIGSFGPIDLNPSSPTYGYITSTPKVGWEGVDIAGMVRRALGVPVGFDTDVNVAALGEYFWGAAQGVDTFIYLTIGTGIGGGGLFHGMRMHGLLHPEMGHIYIPHDRKKDPFDGVCPYHGDCLEGLAAGPSIEKRWGQRAETLPEDHPAWDLEAHYLALALVNYICNLSPRRIVMGGGVMEQPQLLPRIRRKVLELLNGYVKVPQIVDGIDSYIVSPGLGNRAGILGAIALAREVAR